MVVILCVGSISLLFDGGSDGPGTTIKIPSFSEEPAGPCSHRDANDNGVCENCGELYSDVCDVTAHRDSDDNKFCDKCNASYEDEQDVFGGTVTQLFTFSEGEDIMGFGYAGNKYGTKDFSDGYAKLYTTEEDAGIEIDNHINFVLDKSGNAISFESVDYITLDLDIWTDDSFLLPIVFNFSNSAGERFTGNAPKIYKNSDGEAYFTIHGQESYVKLKTFNGTEPIHVTFVIKGAKSGSNYYPQVCIYLDGKRAMTTVLAASSDLMNMRLSIGKQVVEANKSVCLDNIQVATFGNGSGSYDGAIATAFSENGYSLTECIDSVLYNKNN